jgi:hypothetical protein
MGFLLLGYDQGAMSGIMNVPPPGCRLGSS